MNIGYKTCFSILFFFVKVDLLIAQNATILNDTKNLLVLTFSDTLKNNKIEYIIPKQHYTFNNFAKHNEGYLINFILGTNQNPIYIYPKDSVIIKEINGNFIFIGNRFSEWAFFKEIEKFGFPFISIKSWDFKFSNYNSKIAAGNFRKEIFYNLFQHYSDKNKFSKEFKKLIKKEFEYAYISNFCKAINEATFIGEKEKGNIIIYLKSFEEKLLKANNRDGIIFENAINEWSKALTKLYDPNKLDKKKSKTYNNMYDFDLFENFDNRIKYAYKQLNNPIRDEVIFYLLKFKYLSNSWDSFEDSEKYSNEFFLRCKNKKMINELKEFNKILIVKNSISSNSKIWGATKMMSENERITNWNDFVNKNKENVIYVDFWASWCGPCIKEIKESYQNLKSFGNKKVKFANISIDENLDFWKSSIKKLNIENDILNFVIDPKSELAKYFKASESIPRHVLIDKGGNIRSIMAPGANSILFEKTINDLLIEK